MTFWSVSGEFADMSGDRRSKNDQQFPRGANVKEKLVSSEFVSSPKSPNQKADIIREQKALAIDQQISRRFNACDLRGPHPNTSSYNGHDLISSAGFLRDFTAPKTFDSDRKLREHYIEKKTQYAQEYGGDDGNSNYAYGSLLNSIEEKIKGNPEIAKKNRAPSLDPRVANVDSFLAAKRANKTSIAGKDSAPKLSESISRKNHFDSQQLPNLDGGVVEYQKRAEEQREGASITSPRISPRGRHLDEISPLFCESSSRTMKDHSTGRSLAEPPLNNVKPNFSSYTQPVSANSSINGQDFDLSDEEEEAKRQKLMERLMLMDRYIFLTMPIPENIGKVECYIVRRRAGSTAMFPEYHMYLKSGEIFLLGSKKRPKNRSSNYSISMDQCELNNKDSSSFIGKVRSNFLGTEFVVYDHGINPKVISKSANSGKPVRREMCRISYAKNILGSRGPRKVKAYVPKVNTDGILVEHNHSNPRKRQACISSWEDSEKAIKLVNKQPRWNESIGAYVLNFNGRVTMASVKNFQMIPEDDEDTVYFQFGRTAKNRFSLDFSWPLSPVQAFGLAISSLDSKIACE